MIRFGISVFINISYRNITIETFIKWRCGRMEREGRATFISILLMNVKHLKHIVRSRARLKIFTARQSRHIQRVCEFSASAVRRFNGFCQLCCLSRELMQRSRVLFVFGGKARVLFYLSNAGKRGRGEAEDPSLSRWRKRRRRKRQANNVWRRHVR